MSPYRKPMPSFTLVLTSRAPSFPSALIQLSPAMLPTAPDSLMKTIDLRHQSTYEEFIEDCGKDVDSQTIFAAEDPATFHHIVVTEKTTEQSDINFVKRNALFLIHKLVAYKRKFVIYKNGPIVLL